MKDDFDLFSFANSEVTFSSTYKMVERTDNVQCIGGIKISNTITSVENFSFGERQLSEVVEEYTDDLSWLL